MSNVIIIGNGPAGVSASLYTARAGVETTIIGSGLGALGKAEKIENYYGFAEPVDAKELVAAGIAQAKRAGVNYIEDEVVGIGFGQKLMVSTKTNSYEADYVVLSTGASRSSHSRPPGAGRPWRQLLRCLRCLFLPRQGCGSAGQRRICHA